MSLVNLAASEVSSLLAAGKIILIDVREQAEWDAGRVAGARLFPLSSFDPHRLPEGNLVFMCGAGVRSARAVAAAQAAGLKCNQHLAGGMGAWKAAGLPVEV